MGANQTNQKMGKRELIWIDGNVNNDENNEYKVEIKKISSIKLSCFEKIPEAIKYLKQLEFIPTYIICSGRLFPEFIKLFKTSIKDFSICPKIVIFCGSIKSFLERNKNKIDLPINHSFYNSGGVQDTFDGVKSFLLKENIINIQPDSNTSKGPSEDNPEDKVYFESILNQNQLILPLFFSKYIKKPTESQIKKFNNYLLKNYSSNQEIKNLIEQLIGVENIPYEILYKYWLKAFSIESKLREEITKELKINNFKDFLVFVSIMYEGAQKINSSPNIPDNTCLYKYTKLSKAKLDNINFILTKSTKDYLPYLILYSNSFYSFYFDKNDKSNNKDDNNVLLVIENVKKNLECCSGYISLEKYNNNIKNKIDFFPFLFFEIIKMEKIDDNNYKIYLGCLGQYGDLFKGEEHNILIEKIPESSSVTREIINNNLIDDVYMDLYNIITIKYDISNLDTNLKLFDKKFVENNKNFCYMIINDKHLELQEELPINEYKKEDAKVFTVKLAGLNIIKDISYLFNECNNLIEVPNISKITTSNITNMCGMFRHCSKLASLPDISKWDTSSVTDMSFLFSGCSSLQRLPDISKWKTNKVTNLSYMFDSCSGLQLLPLIGKWTTDSFENISYMFNGCSSLNSLPEISKWNIENVKNKEHMFDGLKENISIPEKFKK